LIDGKKKFEEWNDRNGTKVRETLSQTNSLSPMGGPGMLTTTSQITTYSKCGHKNMSMSHLNLKSKDS